MNILLLSNSAPNYFHFFNALSKMFLRDGARVIVAVDSTFSRQENQLDCVGFAGIHDFSAYFKNHQTDREILKRYADYDLNGALLSDFERSEVYGIWGGRTDVEYFDRLKSALLKFFDDIFEKFGIDQVLYEGVSNAFAHFALFVANRKGARYIGLAGSRLPGRFSVVADPVNDNQTAENFRDIREGRMAVPHEVRQWAREYIESIENITPDYMKTNGLDRIYVLKRYLRRDRLAKMRSLARHIFDDRTSAFQVGNPLRTHVNLFARNIRRRLRARTVGKMYDAPVTGEEFLFYPLHFHPESSTSILSGTYLDEYEVIRNIAFSLPEGLRLYVKDHLSAWAYPSLSFYRRIRRLPNVRLLAPDAATKRLIKLSRGVITLTSTVGYEALLLHRPVFLFGTVFYDFHAGVTKIENPSKLRRLLQDKLDQPSEWDERYNEDFVSAYYLATYPGRLDMMLAGKPADRMAKHVYGELTRNEVPKSRVSHAPCLR